MSGPRTGAAVRGCRRENRQELAARRGADHDRLHGLVAHPLTAPLTELLLRSFGPRQVLAEELEGVEGVQGLTCSARGPRGTRARPAARRRT
jgi:hypothetical protein